MKHTNQSGFVVWILVVIGLILALTVMGFFTQNVKRAYGPTSNSPEVVSNPTTPTPTLPVEKPVLCGINVDTPVEGGTIKSPAVIQGYTNNGCAWEVVDGNLATVQLFTSSDVPVTTPIPVSLLGSTNAETVSFFTTLVYPDTTSALSGYLLFVHSGTGFTHKVSVKY
jgi:hypothetical protein